MTEVLKDDIQKTQPPRGIGQGGRFGMILGALLASVFGGILFTTTVPFWVFAFTIIDTAIAFFGAFLLGFLI